MTCCDTCPFSPTCDEEADFLTSIGPGEQWGEEYDDGLPRIPLGGIADSGYDATGGAW